MWINRVFRDEEGGGDPAPTGGAPAPAGGAPAPTGGDPTPNWLEGLDSDVRGFVEGKGYSEETMQQDLAKGYYSLTRLHTKDPSVIGLPGEEADEEAWGAFFNQLGRPSEATGYVPEFAEGAEVDEPTLEWFRGLAHKAGINNKQFSTLANGWNERLAGLTTQQDEDAEATKNEAFETLKKDWGSTLNENVASGQKLVRALGTDLDEATLSTFESEVGTPAMMKVLAVLGKRLGEDDFLRDMQDNSFGGDTKQQAAAEIERLRNDTEFTKSLTDPVHAGHKANNDKWRRLNATANAA